MSTGNYEGSAKIMQEAYDKIVAERDKLLNDNRDLESAKQTSLIKLQAAEFEYRGIVDKYTEATQPRLSELNNDIAALARLLPNHVKAPE